MAFDNDGRKVILTLCDDQLRELLDLRGAGGSPTSGCKSNTGTFAFHYSEQLSKSMYLFLGSLLQQASKLDQLASEWSANRQLELLLQDVRNFVAVKAFKTRTVQHLNSR